MNISIKDIKNYIKNELNSNLSDYNYYCKNSNNQVIPNENITITGKICLHMRNYKPIIVDESDWIYVEFLNFSTSSQNEAKRFEIRHLLKNISIINFNIVLESFKMKTNNRDCIEKLIFYVQVDLNHCELIEPANELMINSINEIQNSLHKTKELVKCLTFSNESEDSQNEYFYLFKVINMGCIYSLTNSQFKSKLRADCKVEIISIDSAFDNSKESFQIVMAFVSKYLFFYNFISPNHSYIIKSNRNLNLNAKISNKDKDNIVLNSIVFFDESISFVEKSKFNEQYKLDLYAQKLSNQSIISNENFFNKEFIPILNGILVEKRIMNKYQTNFDEDYQHNLMNHYDILLSNKEYKLVIQFDCEQESKYLTVYYDTRYSLHQLSILPGMSIQMTNLIKKSDLVYKANSSLYSNFKQHLSLVKIDSNEQKYEKTVKSDLIYDKLFNLNNIFDSFYSRQTKMNENINVNHENYRYNLLYKESYKSENNLKIVAQIIKIYELCLRLRCKICNMFVGACSCSFKTLSEKCKNHKLEFSTTFLIDDHTSLLRVCYKNFDFDLKSTHSNLFTHISELILVILVEYLNEISIPTIPNQMTYDSDDNFYNGVGGSIQRQDSNKMNNSNLVDSFYQNKNYINDSMLSDAIKTLHEFLSNTVLNRYFLFTIDENTQHGKDLIRSKYGRLNKNLIKLSDINTNNEQFKSILTVDCIMFKPLDDINIDYLQ